MLWYVTVLVNVALLGVEPPTGWMQDINPYTTKEECHQHIPERAEEIKAAIDNWTSEMGVIVKIECMPLDDWYNRNIELGHPEPEGGLEKLKEKQEGFNKENNTNS